MTSYCISTPKIASKVLKKRKKLNHKCQQNGWISNCELEPTCNWLNDIIVRGWPWGFE